MRILCLLLAFTAMGLAQRHKLGDLDARQPEGKLLQEILQENDAARKTALLEQFGQQFPKSPDAPWVFEQLQTAWAAANQPDKVIDAGEKLLALDPDDPDAAMQNLKAAAAKYDAAGVQKWWVLAAANAQKSGDAAYAKQMGSYAEYAVYSAAVEAHDAAATAALLEELLRRDPQGEYAARANSALFVAYRQSHAGEKALALAEKLAAANQADEDMLLALSDNYLQNKKEPDKIHAYAAKAIAVVTARPKPEGMSDADWTARKNLITGVAHYMSGKEYYEESKFAPADEELRAALPLVEGNAAMKPEVLYLLGFANYKLDKPQEAADYYRACAALKSPFQATAAKNLQGIKTQYRGIH